MQLSNRMVKDDFWTDTELIKELPPTGRLLYQGLWQLAEATGVLENDPMAYKMQLFPGDQDVTLEQVEEWTEKLVELGKLIPFQDNGDEYFYIKNFHKHQSFSHPAKPDLPLPEWVEYIPNPEKHKTGAYAIHFGMINGSHEEGTKFVGKPPEDYEKDTGDAQETHASGTGNEKEKEKEKELEKEEKTSGKSPEENSIRFGEDSTEYQLALQLRERIVDFHDPVPGKVPDPNPEDMSKWSYDMDKLIRLGEPGGEDDGPTPEQVEYIIHWIYDIDDFWRTTIQSPHGIRNNLSQITAQIRQQKGQSKHEKVQKALERAREADEREETKDETQ